MVAAAAVAAEEETDDVQWLVELVGWWRSFRERDRERERAGVVRTQHVPPATVWARPLLVTLLKHASRCCSASRSRGFGLSGSGVFAAHARI